MPPSRSAATEPRRGSPGPGPLSTIVASALRCSSCNLRGGPDALRSFKPSGLSALKRSTPVPNDLQSHARKARRVRTTMTVVSHLKRKQTTVLGTVPAPLRQTAQLRRIEIFPQRDRRPHAELPIAGWAIESETADPGNPLHESQISAAGIMPYPPMSCRSTEAISAGATKCLSRRRRAAMSRRAAHC